MKMTLWLIRLLLSTVLVLISGSMGVMAAKLSVSPVTINLHRGSSSGTVTVSNAENDDVRMQIQGYSWSKSENGHPVIHPTDDIVVFPELITIPGHSQRDIRIGATVESGPIEKDYRILFSQLPEQDSKHPRSGITFLTCFSVPLFLAPQAKGERKLIVPSATIHPTSIDFDLENLGTAHIEARVLEVTGYGAQGQIILSLMHPAWYLLPGEIAHFKASISTAQSLKIARLQIDVIADMTKHSFGISPQHSDT